jgi:hypothetical protein
LGSFASGCAAIAVSVGTVRLVSIIALVVGLVIFAVGFVGMHRSDAITDI